MTSNADETVLGRITAVFGIKGWVKIHSYTDPVENILDYRQWVLRQDGRRRLVTVSQGKRHGKGLVALLREVDDRDAAQALCGSEIAVESLALPSLPAGEYYWHQLEGLRVFTDGGLDLGHVDHLIETGANDVLVVKPTDSSIDGRERLVPYLPEQVVLDIDLPGNRMTVAWDAEF